MFDTKFSIPFLPLALDSLFKKFGFYTVLLVMNTDMGREHSEKIFGYPTYQKNVQIDIEEVMDGISVDVKDENESIACLKIKMPKKFKMVKKDYNTYFTRDKKIFNVPMNTAAFVAESFKKEDATLTLGSHKISNFLKKFELQPSPLKTMYYKEAIEILNPPQEIGLLKEELQKGYDKLL